MCTRCMLQVGKAYTFKQKCIKAEELLRKQFGISVDDQEIAFEIDEDMIKENYSDDDNEHDEDYFENTKNNDQTPTLIEIQTNDDQKLVDVPQQIDIKEISEEEEEEDEDDEDNVTIYIKQDDDGKTSYYTNENINEDSHQTTDEEEMENDLKIELDNSNNSKHSIDIDIKSNINNDNDNIKTESVDNNVRNDNTQIDMENLFLQGENYQQQESSSNGKIIVDIDQMPKMSLKKRNRIDPNRLKTKSPYKCEECGKTLRNYNSYKYHIQLHSDKSPFLCSHCGNYPLYAIRFEIIIYSFLLCILIRQQI